jgi:hypothetical protein
VDGLSVAADEDYQRDRQRERQQWHDAEAALFDQ